VANAGLFAHDLSLTFVPDLILNASIGISRVAPGFHCFISWSLRTVQRRRQQSRDDSVFVHCPDGSIQTRKRGTRALFAPKTKRIVEQTVDGLVEVNRQLQQAGESRH
jgi:hypothetical protein